MRRLFWVAVGATGAVLVAGRVRRAARRYSPEGLAEQVDEAGRRASSTLREAVGRFGAARREREQELVSTLLVTPEEGDPAAVFGRGKHAARPDRPRDGGPPHHGDQPGEAEHADAAGRRRAGPPGRVDLDEPLNDF